MYKSIRSVIRLPTCITCRRYCSKDGVEFEDPNTKIAVLPNGVRVATEETSSPLGCISLFIEAGPRFETVTNNGITHFIEHMAFQGFKSMSKHQLEESLLFMGTKLTVETTRELQIYTATCFAEYTPHIIELYAKIICELEMDMACIEAEKQVVCEEMEEADNDPKLITFDYLHQTAFQGTPLAQRVIGPSSNLSRFDGDLMSCFMCQHYQPYKLCLASSGSVCHEKIISEAERLLGPIAANPDFISDGGPCRFTGSQVTYRDDSMPLAHIAIGFEVPGYGHADYLPLLVMSCLMGSWCKSQGGVTPQGPPLAIAAAHDICTCYESFYLHYRDVGLWGIYYVAEIMQIEDMLYNIQKQWMYMCTMMTQADLEMAVNVAKLRLAQKVAGAVRTSLDIGYQMMYTCGRRSTTNFHYCLSNIKVQEVRNTAYRYLYDKCPVVAAIGPLEALPDYTRIRSGQYWLRF